MVIWLIGMSGSGKTTLGKEITKQLREFTSNTVLIDGDEIRKIFPHDDIDGQYTINGRRINAERITALCELLDQQRIHVVCCVLSIFPEMQSKNRERFSSYFEVFMDAPLQVLESRDNKGIYSSARLGKLSNVVGIDIKFPRPKLSDMVIDSSGNEKNIKKLATQVLKQSGLLQ